MCWLNRMCAFGQFVRFLELILEMQATRECIFEALLRDKDLFLGWLSQHSLMLFALCLSLELNDVVKSSAHIFIIEVGACLWILVFSAGVIIEVDSLVIIVVKALFSRRVGFLIFNVFIRLLLHLSVGFVVVEVVLIVITADVSAHSPSHLKQVRLFKTGLPTRVSEFLINLNMFANSFI